MNQNARPGLRQAPALSGPPEGKAGPMSCPEPTLPSVGGDGRCRVARDAHQADCRWRAPVRFERARASLAQVSASASSSGVIAP